MTFIVEVLTDCRAPQDEVVIVGRFWWGDESRGKEGGLANVSINPAA